eukprot:m.475434 g.475434  ORF g.475434 m.475434 type:complete len:300 (-) comp57142_c0_seq4:885-1784(-)
MIPLLVPPWPWPPYLRPPAQLVVDVPPLASGDVLRASLAARPQPALAQRAPSPLFAPPRTRQPFRPSSVGLVRARAEDQPFAGLRYDRESPCVAAFPPEEVGICINRCQRAVQSRQCRQGGAGKGSRASERKGKSRDDLSFLPPFLQQGVLLVSESLLSELDGFPVFFCPLLNFLPLTLLLKTEHFAQFSLALSLELLLKLFLLFRLNRMLPALRHDGCLSAFLVFKFGDSLGFKLRSGGSFGGLFALQTRSQFLVLLLFLGLLFSLNSLSIQTCLLGILVAILNALKLRLLDLLLQVT